MLVQFYFIQHAVPFLWYIKIIISWLGEKGSNLQLPGSKPGDFTNLSIPDYMAASLGFEPSLLVPETSVLPVRRQGIKKHRFRGAMKRFLVNLSSRKLR